MTGYSDLNALQSCTTDMGDNTRDNPLLDNTTRISIAGSTEAVAYFRNLESHLAQRISEADAVVGCVAWLTSVPILNALSAIDAVSIIVQKEDFLRPDYGRLSEDWERQLRRLYSGIRPIDTPNHRESGWFETPEKGSPLGIGRSVGVVGIRCVGHQRKGESTIPRMHHKFLVFLRRIPDDDPDVDAGAWPYQPYAVWTGSYNFTNNGNASLENALFLKDSAIAAAYCEEWAQLVTVSESLDWRHKYATPEMYFNTGACCS